MEVYEFAHGNLFDWHLNEVSGSLGPLLHKVCRGKWVIVIVIAMVRVTVKVKVVMVTIIVIVLVMVKVII